MSIKLVLLDEYKRNLPYFIISKTNIHRTPLRLSQPVIFIDSRFQREPKIYVDNLSNESFRLYEGDRYFQLVYPTFNEINIEVVDNLNYPNNAYEIEKIKLNKRSDYIFIPTRRIAKSMAKL